MISSEVVKHHARLLEILASVLEGKPLRQVAEAFNCRLADLQAYAREAGLLPGQDPKPRPPEPEDSLQREEQIEEEPEAPQPRQLASAALHERQVLEEGARRRGDPERQRPDPDAHPYQDESRAALREMLGRVEAERRAYESQPRPHLTLCSDPDFHSGFQPESRLRALITREQLDKAERVRQWYAADLFRWRQSPPEDL